MAKLSAGDPAPSFTLPDQDGNPVSLDDFKGRKVVVYFYPKDDTPGCTTEACQFNDSLPSFQDVPVLGISADSAASHVKFRTKYGLQFPLLTDAGHAVAEQYGAYGQKMLYGKAVTGVIRSTFLIDEQGCLLHAWYSVKTNGHAAQVLAAINP